jgi:hypothetical protein
LEDKLEEINVAAAEALIAWHKLWKNGIKWVPDSVGLERVVKERFKRGVIG